MKKLILLLFIPLISFGQYSSYYGTYNVNADVNINKNINVSGNVNKTVTTIDYGALANANAIRERNRIENLKVANERDREAMIVIANDPSKAFDYGTDNDMFASKKIAKFYGFKRFRSLHKIPHQFLFNYIKAIGFFYQNISDDFITTEIQLRAPVRRGSAAFEKEVKIGEPKFESIFKNVEEYAKLKNHIEGEVSEGVGFIHKKNINKTKIFTINGFKATLIYEDDYEIVIKDSYYALQDEIIYYSYVLYKGDKDEVTFEQLEGRRHYFRKLTDNIISSQAFYDFK